MHDSSPPPPRILLAEDDLTLRRTVKLNFEREGWFVIEAENGEEALQMAKEHYLDAAVLDVMMPKMNGMEVCQKVKKELKLSHVYIIFLTAKGQEVDRQKGLEMVADRYMTKPFDPDEMLTIAEEVLKI